MRRPSPVARIFFATTTAHGAHFGDDTGAVSRSSSDEWVDRESNIEGPETSRRPALWEDARRAVSVTPQRKV